MWPWDPPGGGTQEAASELATAQLRSEVKALQQKLAAASEAVAAAQRANKRPASDAEGVEGKRKKKR
jgi:hypothetical protein